MTIQQPKRYLENGIHLLSCTLIFIFTILTVSIDSWCINSNDTSQGLWRNTTLKTSPEFNGLEVIRGTMLTTIVMAFVLFSFAIYNIIKTFKSSKQPNLYTNMAYAAGTTALLSFITSIQFTMYIKHAGYSPSVSLAISWFTFMLTIIELLMNLRNTMKSKTTKTSTPGAAYMKDSTKRTDVSSKDENQERGNWDSQLEFLLSMIGYAVGLGNVWRFPYLCFENGGGAFVVAYLVMLFLAGIPIFFLEVCMSQFSSLGPIAVWNISPAFRGVGVMMVVFSSFVGIYYNTIIGYSVFYFFSTLELELPWSDCTGYWNNASQYTNKTCSVTFNSSTLSNTSSTLTPSDMYFQHHVTQDVKLDAPEAFNVLGHLMIAVLLAWFVVYFSLLRGIKSSGKVVWFTAVFPYVVLVLLFFRGITLDGAGKGIDFYIGSGSDWTKLYSATTWRKAATQIFFSLSAGWGGLQALSSYNNFHNNAFRDTLIVCFVNCGTSIFAGFAIFSILGNMAHTHGITEIKDVVKDGFSLAFVAYPNALQNLAYPNLWSGLFFLMLFTLGLDSQFTTLETFVTAMTDVWPKTLRKRKEILVLGQCLVMFVIGTLTCTRSGQSWIKMLDNYTGSWGLLFSTLIEIVVLGSLYGGGVYAWATGKEERLIQDITLMIGKKSWLFWLPWRLCWYIITPILLTVLLVWSLRGDITIEGHPTWATLLGWLILMSGLLWVPGMFIYSVVKSFSKNSNLGMAQVWKRALSPNKKWGPYLDQHRVGTRYEKQMNMEQPPPIKGVSKAKPVINQG